jgi:hypothetical protein
VARRRGQELADAVVLFDDVVLMVQVKAKCGKNATMSWAAEKLLEAFKQLGKTHENLVGGHIRKLRNDFYGELEFDPKVYPNRIGIMKPLSTRRSTITRRKDVRWNRG